MRLGPDLAKIAVALDAISFSADNGRMNLPIRSGRKCHNLDRKCWRSP